jgi:hypothetical protein
MKRIIPIMLGMSLALGTAFADDKKPAKTDATTATDASGKAKKAKKPKKEKPASSTAAPTK